MEQPEVADDPWAEVLKNKAFVAIVRPDVAQYRHRVALAGDIGEVLPILGGRLDADAFDILHHRETQRVGIDAGIAAVIVIRLENNVGVGPQELHHRAVGEFSQLM